MNLQDKIYNTLKEIVAIPSVSGTEGENLISEKIYDILSEMQYFKENKEKFGFGSIDKDPLGRKFVWAVVDGKEESKDTLILTGHLDVVEVEEYSHLKNIAYNIEECTKRINELVLDEEAAIDFQSGNWIFGRGTADMKHGIALNIEILREFSESRDFRGKLMILLVPGEESNSEGMIASVPFLLKLQEEQGYNFCGAILSECCKPNSRNDIYKKMYMGTVGKIMPLFFCVGKETHVGEALKGFNPNSLVSEVNRLLEGNPDFTDKVKGSTTLPPMCLKQMDLKELYSVQSPLYAAAYYNILTLNRDEEILLSELEELAHTAFINVLADIRDKREKYLTMCDGEVQFLQVEPYVITYKELLSEIKDENFHNDLNEKVEIWKSEKMDNQSIAINIVKETYEKYENKRPMIIVSFIPPYYPNKYLNENEVKFINAIDETIQYAEDIYNEKIIKEDYFMGISDMSYTGISKNHGLDKLASNIVGCGMNYDLPLESLSKLNIPAIIFGGEGKDIHKYTERLNIKYSFEVVPELYKFLINTLLK